MASDKKIAVVILANENPEGHYLWIKACEDLQELVVWRVVNLCSSDWWEELYSQRFDLLLSRPGGLHSCYKTLYDERIRILSSVMHEAVFPTQTEVEIYENKRYLSFWLKANKIPHPATKVYYEKSEAVNAIKESKFPLVGKSNIGASGSGVVILHNLSEAMGYINRAFSKKGVPRRWGPNVAKGQIVKRALQAFRHLNYIKRKAKIYNTRRSDKQIGYLILQEFVKHEFEWRVVRMGESFFAHKKLKLGEKTSGSLLKGYEQPPLQLLDFVRNITQKHRLYSQAVDIFESEQGYLVNEMQCFFGQSDPHQMIIDGKPGRYLYSDGEWIFEAGNFNDNESFNLRLLAAIDLFRKGMIG